MNDRILNKNDAIDLVNSHMDRELLEYLKANNAYGIPLGEDEYAHVVHCIKSMVAELFGLYDCGHFGQAVLHNNFTNAVCRADETNLKALKLYSIFLYNCVSEQKIIGYRNKVANPYK